MEESSSRIKKVLAILLAIIFVVSLTAVSASAPGTGRPGVAYQRQQRRTYNGNQHPPQPSGQTNRLKLH
jgi:hypothetical protein